MTPIDCEPYSPEWWERRRGKATASAARKIITPATGAYSEQASGYIDQLIADTFDPWYGCHEDYQTAEMKNGHLMEPEARSFYEAQFECDVERVGMFVSDDGRSACSPDGKRKGEPRGLEIKCPKPATLVRWLREGGLPVEHKPQVQFSLMVSGYEVWDFLAYAPGLPKLLVEVRPDEYTERLRGYMVRFWEEFDSAMQVVKSKFPPPPPPKILDFGALGTAEVHAYEAPY